MMAVFGSTVHTQVSESYDSEDSAFHIHSTGPKRGLSSLVGIKTSTAAINNTQQSNGGIPGKATASALTNSFQSYQPRPIALVATRWRHVKHKGDWDESKPSTLLPFGFSGILDEISYKIQLFSSPGEDFQFGNLWRIPILPSFSLEFSSLNTKRTPIFSIYINPFYFTVRDGEKN
uniref:Uncharacterized protein n=1 Tax=Solanum tuberosum TaxID=4113 RepID=M1A222_SOLTU